MLIPKASPAMFTDLLPLIQLLKNAPNLAVKRGSLVSSDSLPATWSSLFHAIDVILATNRLPELQKIFNVAVEAIHFGSSRYCIVFVMRKEYWKPWMGFPNFGPHAYFRPAPNKAREEWFAELGFCPHHMGTMNFEIHTDETYASVFH